MKYPTQSLGEAEPCPSLRTQRRRFTPACRTSQLKSSMSPRKSRVDAQDLPAAQRQGQERMRPRGRGSSGVPRRHSEDSDVPAPCRAFPAEQFSLVLVPRQPDPDPQLSRGCSDIFFQQVPFLLRPARVHCCLCSSEPGLTLTPSEPSEDAGTSALNFLPRVVRASGHPWRKVQMKVR